MKIISKLLKKEWPCTFTYLELCHHAHLSILHLCPTCTFIRDCTFNRHHRAECQNDSNDFIEQKSEIIVCYWFDYVWTTPTKIFKFWRYILLLKCPENSRFASLWLRRPACILNHKAFILEWCNMMALFVGGRRNSFLLCCSHCAKEWWQAIHRFSLFKDPATRVSSLCSKSYQHHFVLPLFNRSPYAHYWS